LHPTAVAGRDKTR